MTPASKDCVTLFLVMTARRFVVLKYERDVPAMASRAGCKLNFFTPSELRHDREGAEHYLLGKFNLHDCPKIQDDHWKKTNVPVIH
jgi:hypothetical protein